MTWQYELGLDEWRTGRVFGGAELPVLYAHGVHTQPDSVVLAASDYRRAYAGKLAPVLERLADGGHLCWIGFSFADQRLAAILREVPLLSGTRHDPGAAPAHVAVMAWDPADEASDLGILRSARRSPTARRSSSTQHRAGIIPRWRPCLPGWPTPGSRPPRRRLPAPHPRRPDLVPARTPAGPMSWCGGCRRRIRWRISPAGPRSWPGWTGGPPT